MLFVICNLRIIFGVQLMNTMTMHRKCKKKHSTIRNKIFWTKNMKKDKLMNYNGRCMKCEVKSRRKTSKQKV